MVCTQRFHLPRALYLAHHFGIDAHGLVADRRTYLNAHLDALREWFAVNLALADVMVGRRAHHLGPRLSIEGDGGRTRDHGS